MLHISFDPFPVLETPRLTLRRPIPDDAGQLFAMRSDPEVMRYIPRPLATSVADVEELIRMIDGFVERSERINWAIEVKGSAEVIGMIGYVNIKPEHHRAEVGYSLMRAWHRRGIMREALRTILKYGFEVLDFHTIEAITDADNTASNELLKSSGFRQEAHFIEDFLHEGKYRNSLHFGMLAREWHALNI